MKKSVLIVFICLLGAHVSMGQTDYEDDYFSEFTWGVNKNTNSALIGGLMFKLARRDHDNVFTTYSLEILNVKDQKEQKYYSSTSGTSFVWGKENYLYPIRLRYGKDVLLYKKAPQQGVQISAIMAGGPTAGIVVPYYILYNGEYIPYNSSIAFNAISGSGKFLQGLPDAKVVPGLNAKAGLSFEFGAFKNNVVGIEVGASMEAYTQKIIIMPSQKNRAIFTALYINLYWGTRK